MSAAPRPGTWRRTWVIRGDLSSVGILLLLAGLGWLNVGVMGWTPAWTAGGGLVMMALGAGLLRHTRRAWRALLEEVVARHAHDDPGPSLVPWIHDEVWRAKCGFDPELDGPTVLRAEVDPHLVPYPDDVGVAFREPILRPVSEAEQGLIPAEEVEGAVPEPGDGRALRERLVKTPGRFIALAPRWPVCCGRLATLTSLTADPSDGSLYLPAGGSAEGDPEAPAGLHTYQCRACGRRYRTDPAW